MCLVPPLAVSQLTAKVRNGLWFSSVFVHFGGGDDRKMCRARRRIQSFPNCAPPAQTEHGEGVSEAASSGYRLLADGRG
jgi:hypothetical protein